MKATLLREMDQLDREHPDANGRPTIRKVAAGTVIDHPDAFRLVRQGVAMPADEECQRAANRTAQQMAAAQHAYERVKAGIHPDDYESYDAGIMAGYNPDGSWKLGPAAEQEDDEPLTEEDEL